jgi:outer membrane protein assembly factor BamA
VRIAIVACACAAVTASSPALGDPAVVAPAAPPIAVDPAAAVTPPAIAPVAPTGCIVAFEVRGHSKVKPKTLGYLSHTAIGDLIGPDDIAAIEQALMSSELFETLSVALEPAPGDPSPGVIVVATAVDKHSWIIAPAAFALPGNVAFGVGYAENDFRGLAQKFLLYGQIGTHTSLFFGTFLDPAVRGSRLTWRTDVYAYQRSIDEYVNPHGDASSSVLARTTTASYISAGALIGWNFRWWLGIDLRLRGAYVSFRDAQDADGQPLPLPEKDGWDVSIQTHLTLDHRHRRRGVTWGTYAQLQIEPSVPGLDSYGYQFGLVRAYQSWRLFGDHELELRGIASAGRHMPMHEELTIGGASDLRGYSIDQFRGDVRTVFRAEYSVPLYEWRFLAFRAIGFYDAGYVGFHNPRPADRDYLPNQISAGYARSDVGTGLRVYLNNIVLPLLGLDLGYGIEGHSPEIYFEVGLTDF